MDNKILNDIQINQATTLEKLVTITKSTESLANIIDKLENKVEKINDNAKIISESHQMLKYFLRGIIASVSILGIGYLYFGKEVLDDIKVLQYKVHNLEIQRYIKDNKNE